MTAFVTGRAEKALGVALELAKDERGNFRRRESLVAELDAQHFSGLQVVGEAEGEEFQFFLNVFDAASHQAFDRVDGAFRRFDQILARGVADDGLIISRRARRPRARRFKPSSPGITTGVSPCMNATREFVVPRSMPTMRSEAICNFVIE